MHVRFGDVCGIENNHFFDNMFLFYKFMGLCLVHENKTVAYI